MSIRKATIIRSVIAGVLVAAFIVVGLLVTYEIAEYQRKQYFEVRKFQAAAAAACLDPAAIESLKGEPSDQDTAAFQSLYRQLVLVKKSDARLRYVYLMRPAGNDMIFLVDAESQKSPEYSPPGQVYEQALPEEFEVFEGTRKPDPLVYGPIKDPWGDWISASAFVLNGEGKPIALFGTDVDVKRALSSFNQIKSLGTAYVLVGDVLLALLFLQWIIWSHNRDRRNALREEMERSIVRLNAELLEADRLKSEFIESASHELRGPVTAIDGALQVMEEQCVDGLSEAGNELVDIARSGSTRLVDLVNNLLDLTRIEAGGISVRPEKDVDLQEIVAKTLKIFEALARERGLKTSVDFPDGGMVADVDPQALRRVLENLVSNAIKFTDKGEIVIKAYGTDGTVHMVVKDTGRGIPEKFRAEVFKKFSRLHLSTDSHERGAGLGLAIAKGLIEAHGGRIWIDSEEGKGTEVHFEFPKTSPIAVVVDTGEPPGLS